MTRFVVGEDRSQSTMFPERLDDYLGEDNPVRAASIKKSQGSFIAGRAPYDPLADQANNRMAFSTSRAFRKSSM
jgi:hypothetical protein